MKTLFDAMIRSSIRHRWVVVLATILVAALGVWSGASASMDALPDFTPPIVIVQTEAPGFATTAVETRVTTPLEQGLLGIPGVRNVRSTSSPGLSVVRMTFDDDVEIHRARQLVTERLAEARSRLPSSLPPPRLGPITAPVGVLTRLAYTTPSNDIQTLWLFAEWKLRSRLIAIEGVSRVTIHGGSPARLRVALDPRAMIARGLVADDIRQALVNAQTTAAVGVQDRGSQQEPLRADALFTWGDPGRIAAVAIGSKDGVPIRISDVAKVEHAAAPPLGEALYDGRRAISVTIEKLPWADTLRLTEQVDAALRELDAELPAGARRERPSFKQSDFIRTSLRSLARAMGLGAVLVVIVLVALLRSPRVAGITVTALPLSILAAVAVLRMRGITVNGMILGGLAIAVGEVVDDAIVDVENIWTRLRENAARPEPKPALDVVHDASIEVRGSVVYASLIIVAILLPIMVLGGLSGRIFSPLAEAYALAIVASLVVALTVTPAMSAILLPRIAKRAYVEPALTRVLRRHYDAVLRLVARRPRGVVASAVLLSAAAAVILPFLGGAFVPELHEGVFIAQVDVPPGTSLAETTRLVSRASEALRRENVAQHVAARIGRATNDEDAAPVHHAEVDIVLPNDRDPEDIEEAAREQLALFPGMRFAVEGFLGERINEILSGERAPIAVKVYGEDLDAMRTAADAIGARMKANPDVRGVRSSSPADVPAIDIQYDDRRLAALGMRRSDAIEGAALSRNGLDVTSATAAAGVPVPVVLTTTGTFAVSDIPVFSRMGIAIPLGSVADVVESREPPAIEHEGGRRVVSVTGSAEAARLSRVAGDLESWLARTKLPPGTSAEVTGQAIERRGAATRLLLTVAIVLTAVLVFLWVAFGSLLDAGVILAGLPLGLVGGVLGALVLPDGLSMAGLVGFVALAGIICRNGIMLVTHKNELAATRGAGVLDEGIVLDAARDRLLPILMTAATAFLGLIPLAASIGAAGSELEAPMAVVVCGGLVTSTLLNLVAVPAFYIWRVRRAQTSEAVG